MDAKTGSIGGCPMGHGDGGVRSLLGRTNRDWWPDALAVDILAPNGAVEPDGRRLRLCRGVQRARLQRAQGRPDRADDRQPAVVAGGLRPLRPVLHPHGVARRGHLSHRRRARRRQQRAAALRPAQFAGPTTATSTRRAACCGRSSRSTASTSAGPTCSSSPATSRSNRWAARCSASAAAAPTCSSPRRTSTGATRTSGSTKASQTRIDPDEGLDELDGPARRDPDGPDLRQSRRARAAIPTRCSRRATSRRRSSAWR